MTSHEDHPEAMTSHDDPQDPTQVEAGETTAGTHNPDDELLRNLVPQWTEEELRSLDEAFPEVCIRTRYKADPPLGYYGEGETYPRKNETSSSYAGEYLNIRSGTWGNENHQPDSREYDGEAEIDLDYFIWNALN